VLVIQALLVMRNQQYFTSELTTWKDIFGNQLIKIFHTVVIITASLFTAGTLLVWHLTCEKPVIITASSFTAGTLLVWYLACEKAHHHHCILVHCWDTAGVASDL